MKINLKILQKQIMLENQIKLIEKKQLTPINFIGEIVTHLVDPRIIFKILLASILGFITAVFIILIRATLSLKRD